MRMPTRDERQLAIDFGRDYSAPICIHCGEPQVVRLFEIWSDHAFQIETCCGVLHEELVWEMQDPDFRTALLRNLMAAEHMGARSLRRVAECDGHFLLDCELEIRPIDFWRVRAFVEAHHDHCPPPRGWRFGAGVWNGSTLVGVVAVGRPSSPALPQRSWVEVTRLCVNRGLPDALRWKACSVLYGWAAAEAEARGFAKIITYTLKSEAGLSLRYARWRPEHETRAQSWNRPSRPRVDKTPIVPKIRWTPSRPFATSAAGVAGQAA